MVDQVWLDAAEQSELRSHYALKWVMDTLLERNIRITYTVGKVIPKRRGSKDGTKRGKVGSKVVSMGQGRTRRWSLSRSCRRFKRKNSKEDQLKLKKHDIAMFYSNHDDAFEAPPSPSLDLVAADNDGKTRKQIRNLTKALTFMKDRDYLLHLDMLDLQCDVSEEDAKVYTKRRSKHDAKHHLAEARQLYMLLRLICAEHSELEEVLSAWCGLTFPSHTKSSDDILDFYLQDIKANGRFTNCRVSRDLEYQACVSGRVRCSIQSWFNPQVSTSKILYVEPWICPRHHSTCYLRVEPLYASTRWI